MNKNLARALAAIVAAGALTACKGDTCDKRHTGQITVTNGDPAEIMVDVITPSTGAVNEVRSLEPGESTTYTIPAGEEAQVRADSKIVATYELAPCQTITHILQADNQLRESDNRPRRADYNRCVDTHHR